MFLGLRNKIIRFRDVYWSVGLRFLAATSSSHCAAANSWIYSIFHVLEQGLLAEAAGQTQLQHCCTGLFRRSHRATGSALRQHVFRVVCEASAGPYSRSCIGDGGRLGCRPHVVLGCQHVRVEGAELDSASRHGPSSRHRSRNVWSSKQSKQGGHSRMGENESQHHSLCGHCSSRTDQAPRHEKHVLSSKLYNWNTLFCKLFSSYRNMKYDFLQFKYNAFKVVELYRELFPTWCIADTYRWLNPGNPNYGHYYKKSMGPLHSECLARRKKVNSSGK